MPTKKKNDKDWLIPLEAIDLLAKNGISASYPTLIAWVREYGLGSKPKGRWFIDKAKLSAFAKEYFFTEIKTTFKGG